MLAEIVLTSPNKEVTQLVKKIRKELNVNVAIVETSFDSAVSMVKSILSQEPDRIRVIASGGATLELLRQELPSVHLVSIHPNEYDIVLALDQARMFGQEIALFHAGSENLPAIEKLCRVLGLEVQVYVYNSWKELEVQVVKARRNGSKVVLGVGEKILDLVKKEGLHYIPLTAGENTLRNALEWAKDIVEAESREKNKSKKESSTKGLVAKYCFNDIIHVNNKMSSLIKKAKKFASTDCTVLIRGESGTGKELLAQSMHNENKMRCKGPFVAVNCASLDDHLFKSELFGYTEGSFTGASKGGKPGLFELANGGTLFLDEIGKMKMEQQGNLLRVLQEKEVRRIGSDRIIPVDVRVIAASNEDLESLISKDLFREDLYFRLNVLKLEVPTLRERREDIPSQVAYFLHKFSDKYSKKIYSLPTFVLRKLSNVDWPGNSRQLEHFLERCVVLADDESDVPSIVMELLEEEFLETAFIGRSEGKPAEGQISVCISTLAEMNSEIVRRISAKAKLSNSELAMKLGISRPTLSKMLNYK
ncbi:MAG TPA: ArsR family transcriptional regulator [Desulfosporosinus sp.]|nr:ArsR family transcriptional regulator [Desulfosporosinus sp.]